MGRGTLRGSPADANSFSPLDGARCLGETVGVATPTQDDLERLANRLALLASSDGEADNAGRAVAQMARRLGLSGGDLKEMFLAGQRGAGQRGPRAVPEPAADHGDVIELRRRVRDLETLLRSAQQDREALQAELTGFKLQSYRTQARRGPMLAMFAIAGALAIGVGGLIVAYAPDITGGPGPREPRAAALTGSGVVRGRNVMVYREPDRAAPPVATLNAGAQVVVRRLVWNSFSQWAEVEVPGASGYMLATDLDLR